MCLVVDRGAVRGDLAAAVSAAVRGGVDWVQVRDRGLEGAALLELTRTLVAAAGSPAVRFVVNRRVDVALAADAAGVHLGFDGMPAETARRLLGEDALVGVSAHAPAELRNLRGASYAHLAPVFAPLSKASERPPLRLPALAEAADAGVPVLAQGGIDASNASATVAAGAAGVAVTGAILLSDDPERAARALRAALDGAPG